MCDIVEAAANVARVMMGYFFRHARAQGGGALGGRRGGVFVVAVGLVVEGGKRCRGPVELKITLILLMASCRIARTRAQGGGTRGVL